MAGFTNRIIRAAKLDAAVYEEVKCLISISNGSSTAIPICLRIDNTNGSKVSLGVLDSITSTLSSVVP